MTSLEQPTPAAAREAVVNVLIENYYSDGHLSEETVTVPAPEGEDLEDWWNDVVFEHIGDGHGADRPDLHSHHTATIIEAENSTLIGSHNEWED